MNKELTLKNKIHLIRGKQVMIDKDLAEFYAVPTKVLNQAVKRNLGRFPKDFIFQLTENEKNELVTNCDQLNQLKHSSQLPYAFTEQGVAMLSSLLKSKRAIQVSIQIIRAFIALRHLIVKNGQLFIRLENIERKQIQYDENFEKIFDAIEKKQIKPKQGIFFNGQIFDAYAFISRLIRNASKSIVLIDNYVDDSVLTLFAKRNENVPVTIYTKKITKQLKLDIEKYHSQYPEIKLKGFKLSHDRFLIIDNKDIYHIGASLKDLGKKWFAFSKLDKSSFEALSKELPC